jgi:DNA polymerase-3 subunit epsilon
MKIGLALDFETTGLDLVNDRILEIGYIRFADKSIIDMRSFLIHQDEKVLTPGAQKVSSFNIGMVNTYGYAEEPSIRTLSKAMESVDYILAHNGRSYDKIMYENACKRLGLTPVEKLWVDTMEDIPFDEYKFSKKLVYLAADHNFLNPYPHRAVTDVLTMLQIYFKYDEDEAIKMALAPTVKIFALDLPFSKKDLAKDRGYKWDADARIWSLTMKDLGDNVQTECAECGFKTKVVR